MLTSICPIFPSSDFTKTTAFYDQLGFRMEYIYEQEGYLILSRDEVELHFFRDAAHDSTKSNHGAFVRLKDARELSHEYQQLSLPTEGIPRVTVAKDMYWGICEFAIVDTDGNLLRVGHIID